MNILQEPSFLQNQLSSTQRPDLTSALISQSELQREILFVKILDYLEILTFFSQIIFPHGDYQIVIVIHAV